MTGPVVTEAWFYEVANRLVSWRDREPGFSMSAAEVLTSILTEAGVSLPDDSRGPDRG